jgi:hypothetical protein
MAVEEAQVGKLIITETQEVQVQEQDQLITQHTQEVLEQQAPQDKVIMEEIHKVQGKDRMVQAVEEREEREEMVVLKEQLKEETVVQELVLILLYL